MLALSAFAALALSVSTTAAPASAASRNFKDALRAAEATHAAELQSEVATSLTPETVPPADGFDDANSFWTHDVGAQFAGPDADALQNAHLVHRTEFPVLSRDECMALRDEAGAAMDAGITSTFSYTAAQNLGEVHLSDLAKGRDWLRTKLQTTLLPLLSSRFGVPAESLRVYDSLIIRYDAARNATRQPMHRDASLLSLNVALSDEDEYAGGGTLFEGSGEVLRVPMGHCMCHASGVRHAGHAIHRGQRWVLVVFLLATECPQYARRCGEHAALAKAHAHALRRAGGDVDECLKALDAADAALEAGLAMAPTDHELHHAMAGLHAMRDEPVKARESLRIASELYPKCPKPRNALGSLLIAANRHRAALRHFERAYDLSPPTRPPDGADEDDSGAISDDDAWEAAVNGGLCVVELLSHRGKSPVPISQAIRWLRGALAAAPGDPRLEALLARAEALA